jgi:hypothetical protein
VENYRVEHLTFVTEKIEIPLNHHLLKFFFFVCFCCILGLTAQAQQHPIGYSSLHATSQNGSFVFPELNRPILKEKTASFFSPEPVSLTFDILVTPEGQVKYVRAPRLTNDQGDLRRACTSALYGFAFAQVTSSSGDQWIKATLVCEEN